MKGLLIGHALVATFVLSVVSGAVAQSKTTASQPQARPSLSLEGEYRLSIGDVLEISVRGFPDLRQRSLIEINGEVSLPLAGRVRVADMTIADAQAVIRRLVTTRPLAQRTGDGRETFTVLAEDDVNISIAEYRPIYVLGDVGKPGEVAFRPGLTARQVIALAGGFDVMRYRLVNPFTESAEMKSQQETLWTEMARIRAQVARIRAELGGTEELDRTTLKDIPLAPAFIEQVLKTEAETLKSRMDDYGQEREHVKVLIRRNEERVETLVAVLQNEEEALREDKKEYSDLAEFNKRGSVPMLRMMDVRRVQSASATRLLQTRVQLDQARKDLSETMRALERFDNARHTELLKQLQDTNVAENSLQAKLSANSEKLIHTSMLKSRLIRGPGAKATINVYRVVNNVRQAISGNEDSVLLPGDTIEIILQNEFDVESGREPVSVRSAKAPT